MRAAFLGEGGHAIDHAAAEARAASGSIHDDILHSSDEMAERCGGGQALKEQRDASEERRRIGGERALRRVGHHQHDMHAVGAAEAADLSAECLI